MNAKVQDCAGTISVNISDMKHGAKFNLLEKHQIGPRIKWQKMMQLESCGGVPGCSCHAWDDDRKGRFIGLIYPGNGSWLF